MNILFLSLASISSVRTRSLYMDLILELEERGHNLYVVSPIERRNWNVSEKIDNNGKKIELIRVKTGNITKTKSIIEKGISTLTIEKRFLSKLKKTHPNTPFDLVLYSTPPITFSKILKYYKSKYNAITYLMLKDIFPQNALDLQYFKENSVVHKFFRAKEKKLYNNSDIIGCMSERNVSYLMEKNSDYLDCKKLEIFPNSISISKKKPLTIDQIKSIRNELNIDSDKTVFLYAGNLGKPQGVDLLIDFAKRFDEVSNSTLLVVGGGTEFQRISDEFSNLSNRNVILLSSLPKKAYDKLASIANVGMIILDHNFTIPNFPSRITSYLENSLAVLAATDTSTDLGQKIQEGQFGLWCESDNLEDFLNNAKRLAESSKLVNEMGKNARIYVENNYDISKNVDIILKHFDKGDFSE